MAWKETCVEDERVRFVVACRAMPREVAISELCRSFGISRKTGYKWLGRYTQQGVDGLKDQSRAPKAPAHAVEPVVVARIVQARQRWRYWGPRKLRAWLKRTDPTVVWPASSTIGAILHRHGLSAARTRPRRWPTPAGGAGAVVAAAPNEVWGVDFKGWFYTGDHRRCDPLTISDAYSRYLLACQRVDRLTYACARPVFERTFREYGLPGAIRSDNGTPFAAHGLGGLTQLAVWWIKLGIALQRITPGKPQQNGRHERLHQTLKREAACPPRATGRAQQRAFTVFRQRYNQERPHEALDDAVPASHYAASPRPYPRQLAAVDYPGHYEVRRVRQNGEIKWRGELVYLTKALAGEPVGLEPLSERCWRITFASVPLALWDEVTRQLWPLGTVFTEVCP